MLHWNGDTYDLPPGPTSLASTSLKQQAFSIGPHVLGLQFLPEAEIETRLEQWLVGHAAELAAADIDFPALRKGGRRYGKLLKAAAMAMMSEWLASLEARS